VGADFSYNATIPDNPHTDENETVSFVKEPNVIEVKAYRDTWGRGLDSYLSWFYETVVILYESLADNGSIYIHLDYNIGHYAKAIIDEVFGRENFKNEISWKRTSAHANVTARYGNVHDVIFYYTKSENFTWNQQYVPYSQEYIDTFFDQADENGRRYARRDLTAGMDRASKGQKYTWRGITPTGSRCWVYTKDKMDALDADGKIHWPKKVGGMPRLKLYPEDLPGIPVQDLWSDFSQLHNLAAERVGYPTQKPEALLERILKVSSNENDLILDCFGGSGTTAVAAEKLNRRWITCDLGRFAINTSRKRLLSIPDVKPFIVQNLGKYERQAWQAAEFGGEKKAAAMVSQYRRFILDLYRARPIEGYNWLHGIKGGRMVHVGSVDSPISPNDVTQIAIEFKKAMGTGEDAPSITAVDVLGWDFAFELNEVATQQAAQAGIAVKFVRIPREILEKKAVEQGDIKFFELAALSVDIHKKSKEVILTLKDFIIPPDDVPAEVQKAITHWSQWIDYWAVDWDNKDDTFHNMWQTYRTRQDKTLKLKGSHAYEESGEYTVMVKVIDILGNDTTKALKVTVP